MIGIPELIGAIGALVIGALLGLLTPELKKKREAAPVPVPVPVEEDATEQR